MPTNRSLPVAALALLAFAPTGALAETGTASVTTDAYGDVDGDGVAHTFADPTPAGVTITQIDVATEMLPYWTHEAYGDEWFDLEDTIIGEVTTPGSADWVPQTFTYVLGDEGLHDSPPLEFVKDGQNTLTIFSYWNSVEIAEVTLTFTYEASAPEDDTGTDLDTGAGDDGSCGCDALPNVPSATLIFGIALLVRARRAVGV